MIRRAIDRGVSKERLARAFNVNLSSINRRINLLSGICPEKRVLSAEPYQACHALAVRYPLSTQHSYLSTSLATPPEQRADVPPPERDNKTAPMAQLVKLEKEMS